MMCSDFLEVKVKGVTVQYVRMKHIVDVFQHKNEPNIRCIQVAKGKNVWVYNTDMTLLEIMEQLDG